ncbi:MAG: hypothetical protein ACYC77_09865 [Coriobacteriia bacterium]
MNGDERRERRGFEPPPWERDEFERFEKERAEREKEAELAAALEAMKLPPRPPEPEPEPPGAIPVPEPGFIPRDEVPEGSEPAAQDAVEETGAAPLDKEIERMLIDLRIEEPRMAKEYRAVGSVVSGLLLAGGLGFVIWSATLFARTQVNNGTTVALASPLASATASALMMLWGLMMVGGAILLWRKYNVR